jgi:hypothetical protein
VQEVNLALAQHPAIVIDNGTGCVTHAVLFLLSVAAVSASLLL